ncbi:MAG TPA: hypothetical protein VG406_25955 [Isosphaeraceae bacterium]|nr:hypothetical protein [Isosphaeraceae bacterium]
MSHKLAWMGVVAFGMALAGCGSEGTPNAATPNPNEGSQVATKIPPPGKMGMPAAPGAPAAKTPAK